MCLASHQLENPRDFGDAPGDSIAPFSGKPLDILSAIRARFLRVCALFGGFNGYERFLGF
jgi:hypothetical protein